MGMGIRPVLDSQPEFRRSVFDNGKELVQYDKALTAIAHAAGVRPLMDFLSISRAEAVDEIGEDGVEGAEAGARLEGGRWTRNGSYLWSVEPEWFSPAEGLRTIQALRERVETEPTLLGRGVQDEEDAEGVITALQDIEELLTDAERKQRRFHMAVA